MERQLIASFLWLSGFIALPVIVFFLWRHFVFKGDVSPKAAFVFQKAFILLLIPPLMLTIAIGLYLIEEPTELYRSLVFRLSPLQLAIHLVLLQYEGKTPSGSFLTFLAWLLLFSGIIAAIVSKGILGRWKGLWRNIKAKILISKRKKKRRK